MQTPEFRDTERQPQSASPRRHRRMVLIGAAALALVLATAGTVAALGGRSSSSQDAQGPATTPIEIGRAHV